MKVIRERDGEVEIKGASMRVNKITNKAMVIVLITFFIINCLHKHMGLCPNAELCNAI